MDQWRNRITKKSSRPPSAELRPAADFGIMGTCICLKMELHWKSNPIGEVRKNLPFFKELAETNFTQKN
ncbi:MAG: hypothetical protein E3J46_04535 [Desulfobacteraceae bacterium]|nr:MAG: hypothetical protein E3J46_04535 [Desulfobacteraceae bacterium]